MGNNNDKNHPAELTRETRTRFLCLTAMTVCTSTLLLKHKKETRSQRGSTFVFRQKTLLVWLRKTQHLNHSLSYHFKTKKDTQKKKIHPTHENFLPGKCALHVFFFLFFCVCVKCFCDFCKSVVRLYTTFQILFFCVCSDESCSSQPFFVCLFESLKANEEKKKKKLHFWTFFIKFPLVWRSSDWERSATR